MCLEITPSIPEQLTHPAALMPKTPGGLQPLTIMCESGKRLKVNEYDLR